MCGRLWFHTHFMILFEIALSKEVIGYNKSISVNITIYLRIQIGTRKDHLHR
jgi:hypothetical protein